MYIVNTAKQILTSFNKNTIPWFPVTVHFPLSKTSPLGHKSSHIEARGYVALFCVLWNIRAKNHNMSELKAAIVSTSGSYTNK